MTARKGSVEPRPLRKEFRLVAKRELLEAAAIEYERDGEAALNELATAALEYAREAKS